LALDATAPGRLGGGWKVSTIVVELYEAFRAAGVDDVKAKGRRRVGSRQRSAGGSGY
jgi:hypothetical protein